MSNPSETTSSDTPDGTPSRYRTRSVTRSLSDSGMIRSPGDLRFPFFDSEENPPGLEVAASSEMSKRATGGLPHSSMDTPVWEADISPIAKNRESDAGGALMDVHSDTEFSDNVPEALFRTNQADSVSIDAAEHATSDHESNIPLDKQTEALPLEGTVNDLTRAREQVGSSSSAFIESLTDAARKRPMALTRSRDSLVAKEREQLEAIAESKAKAALEDRVHSPAQTSSPCDEHQPPLPTQNRSEFKARPLPETTGIKGSGGLDGIPKVEKKPTTTPFSPLLGSRRPGKIKIKSLEEPTKTKWKTARKATTTVEKKTAATDMGSVVQAFKARTIPPAVRSAGHCGQFGVPKVPKRPATVPQSPLLGNRRSQSAKRASKTGCEKNMLDPKGNVYMQRTPHLAVKKASKCEGSPLVNDSPVLHGLKLLDIATDDRPLGNDENATPMQNRQQDWYEPHSTIRAKKRADYDARRTTILESRMGEEQKRREKEIRRIHRELQVLRHEI